jgi:hypothetical protein
LPFTGSVFCIKELNLPEKDVLLMIVRNMQKHTGTLRTYIFERSVKLADGNFADLITY